MLSRTNICHYGPSKVVLEKILRAARWLSYKMLFLPLQLRDHRNRMNAAALFQMWDYSWASSRTPKSGTFTLVSILDCMRDSQVMDVSGTQQ